MSEVTDRAEQAIARADRVMASLDAHGGAARAAAGRERQRLNRALGRRLAAAGLAIGIISIIAVVVGLVVPIGMFGFLAAVGVAVGLAALLFFWPGEEAAPTVPKDVPNGEMVQKFDSFLYRQRHALPAPAQGVVDSISANLSSLKTTLERVDPMDPDAQDARRLMSVHLPSLVERYRNVPAEFRDRADAEDVTVNERLVEGLDAGRAALAEVSERLAKRDVDAFQTQGRFITTRYGETDTPAP